MLYSFFLIIMKNVGRSSAFRPRYPNIYYRTFFLLEPKFSKNYLTLLEKFKSQADFAKNGKKLLDFLLHALYN